MKIKTFWGDVNLESQTKILRTLQYRADQLHNYRVGLGMAIGKSKEEIEHRMDKYEAQIDALYKQMDTVIEQQPEPKGPHEPGV